MVGTSLSKDDNSNVQFNGVPPNAVMTRSREEAWTLDRLFSLDGREDGDGDFCRSEPGKEKVDRPERSQRLLVVLLLEILDNVNKAF
jgi:hypothetical protein